MITCIFCNHIEEASIVGHLSEHHGEDGLEKHLMLFPSLPVVEKRLLSDAKVTVELGLPSEGWPYSVEIAHLIVHSHNKEVPERSRIYVELEDSDTLLGF